MSVLLPVSFSAMAVAQCSMKSSQAIKAKTEDDKAQIPPPKEINLHAVDFIASLIFVCIAALFGYVFGGGFDDFIEQKTVRLNRDDLEMFWLEMLCQRWRDL
jgi:hypothetical protein